MLDFAALPPEVNSARMYAGPGSGPMMAAATGWDVLAGELELFATGYCSELTSLQGHHWSGPASTAMAAAAAPYVAWANTTATQAERAANQVRAAAAAYEAAFAATVPPPVVEANRALLMALIATNFFGQNTPAIAATEAAYAEMWAQDATAMYGYAGSSLPAAAALTPFKAPPQTTNPGGQPGQSAAAAHALGTAASTTPLGPSNSQYYYINNLASFEHVLDVFHKSIGAPFYNKNVTWADQLGFAGAYSLFGSHLGLPEPALPLLGRGALSGSTSANGGTVLASTGKAASVGPLSVPQSWSTTAPAANPGHVAQSPEPQPPATSDGAVKLASSPTPTMDQLPPALGSMGGSAQHHSGNAVFRMRDRRFRMPRPVVGG